jgi:DNA-binding NtrC family response regulator
MRTQVANTRVSKGSRPCHRVKVLVVPDDAESLEYYREVLEVLGLSVFPVTTSMSDLARLDPETLGFIAASPRGPCFGGQGILERELGNAGPTPILVLTRSGGLGGYIKANHLGAVDHTPEPITVRQIVRLVARHLRWRPEPRLSATEDVKVRARAACSNSSSS